ncbi:hypothetical protein PGTUg99_001381 [Puccinia graminis f. sp. tritici]|nr:hypothetical protein PGTUg99_001381 [Puccinia graminis f. sp. tritici]
MPSELAHPTQPTHPPISTRPFLSFFHPPRPHLKPNHQPFFRPLSITFTANHPPKLVSVCNMTPSKALNNLDLDDMLPELPFSNVEGGSQKAYLGPPLPTMESMDIQRSCVEPLQGSHGVARAVRVFTENPTTESQREAAAGDSGRLSSTPGSTVANNGVIRPIAIDYVLFNQTTTKQIAEVVPSRSKGPAVTPKNEWERIIPYFDTVWKAALEVWSWPQAQQCIITLLGGGRPNIDKHIRAIDEAGLLKWQCILANHGTYGSGKFYYVYSDEDFAPFVAAMVLKPKAKVTIKLIMADPRRSAKDKESEKSQNDSLAMSYAPDDERLALQKVKTRLALNVSLNPADFIIG